MASRISTAFGAWKWSLGVMARSPMFILALAILSGLWGLAGYEWLALPESSVLMLLVALLWILILAAVAVAILAGTAGAAWNAASGSGTHLRLTGVLSFRKTRFLRSLVIAALGGALIVVVALFFGWVNNHAVEVASFLTFHSQKPVSYQLIAKIFWVIEALFWIGLAGFLMSWLLALLPAGWKGTRHDVAAKPIRRRSAAGFVTGVISAGICGWLTWRLAIWRPLVKPGFWDYTQFAIRLGASLLLLAIGWVFWTLALARLRCEANRGPAEAAADEVKPSN